MAVTINYYDLFMEYVGDGGIDLDTDTFKNELHNAYTFSAAHNARADVTGSALATANGYTNPGQNLSSVVWNTTSGTQKFDAADTSWTASGGSIGPATDAIVYSDTSTVPEVDLLMCNVDFGASETAGDGTDFKVTWHANGLFQIS